MDKYKVGRSSYIFDNVYVLSSAGVVGPKEMKGPYSKYFDFSYDTLNISNNSFEKSEIMLVKDAIKIALKKIKIGENMIDVAFCGDLTNQIAVSSYMIRDLGIPYVGLFAACATLTLGIINASFFLEHVKGNALVCTSSHNCTAERQFRYPNEYGAQRANTFTSTVTGAGALILSSTKSKVKVTKATIGKVVDANIKDSQDMGRAMAPACYHTIKTHLEDFNMKVDDYDKIFTGDLSFYGSKLLIDLFMIDKIDIRNVHEDCGLIIYDRNKQVVLSGGSGPGCVAVMTASFIVNKLLNKEYKRVLICATGALMNPTMLAQKESIPGICHAVTLEAVDEELI